MKLRRCGVVFFEPRESVGFDLMSLLAGAAGLSRQTRWLALAPHLDDEVEVDQGEREVLGAVSPSNWIDMASVVGYGVSLIDDFWKKVY